jgi:hypothetical protein
MFTIKNLENLFSNIVSINFATEGQGDIPLNVEQKDKKEKLDKDYEAIK